MPGQDSAALDGGQYTRRGILRYERIFGHTWVSPGGEDTAEEFAQLLKLQPGQTLLDVGCGSGGSAFLFAEKYGVHVVGVDLSSNMIDLAIERLADKPADIKAKVKFILADIMDMECKKESYDVIYSRDTILHIPDKEKLFKRLHAFMKPTGQLLVTDYCRGDQEHKPDFLEYVKNRGYSLETVAAYGRTIARCGYSNVQANDYSGRFRSILEKELSTFKKDKDNFLKEFSEADYDYIVTGWESKMRRSANGDQAWGLFIACK